MKLPVKRASLFLLLLVNTSVAFGRFFRPSGHQGGAVPLNIDFTRLPQQSGSIQLEHLQFEGKALELLSSLKLPETCLYSSLTESLINKCTTSASALDGQEKAAFATKLAVCEFRAASIDFPKQCKGELDADWAVQKCIKVLEGRPQWWTSWSNCLQSVSTMCQAVRVEKERDNIIELHSNLTALYTMLHGQLQDSLGTTGGILQAHKGVAAKIGSFFERFIDGLLRQTTDFSKVLMRPVEERFRQIQDLAKKTEINLERVETQSAVAIDNLNRVQAKTESLHQSSEVNLQLAEKIGESLKTLSAENLRDLSNDISALSTAVGTSLENAEEVEERTLAAQNLLGLLSGNYENLASTFERFSASLEQNRDAQTKSLRDVSAVAASLNTNLNEVLHTLHHKIDAVLQKLDQTEERIGGLVGRRPSLWDLMPFVAIAFARSGRKTAFILLAVSSSSVIVYYLFNLLPRATVATMALQLPHTFGSQNSTSWFHTAKQIFLG